jgi:hypothetical protein
MYGKLSSTFLTVIGLAYQVFALTDATQFNSQSLNQDGSLYFTENKGQWDERVLFKANGAGGLTWWIEREGFTILQSIPDLDAEPIADPCSFDLPDEMRRPDNADRYPNKGHALKFKFQNITQCAVGNFLPEQTSPATAASVESSERLPWNNNYFFGSNSDKWAPDCGNYQRVALKDVWSGIDVVWRGVGKAVEYDFVVTPGADASQIRVECLGLTDDLDATADGEELLLPTSLGVLRQVIPEAFQIDADGSSQEVKVEFTVWGGCFFGISLPEGHDPGKPLVVDPLVYSTYLGGSDQEDPTALCPDGAGGVVVTGDTRSDDFPTTDGAYQSNYEGGSKAFIASLNAEGSALIYCTYLGGSRNDHPKALCPDGDGGVVVAGNTSSNDFPTTDGAYQRNHGGDNLDAFIARLNADGNDLIYSTYLGASRGENASALCPDGDGGVVVAGFTYSDDFPTTDGAYQSDSDDSYEAFITNLNAEGSDLIYSTFLGGGTYDVANAICPDGDGGVFVAGMTRSDGENSFPTTDGAYQREFGGIEDVFISRLNADGSDLIYSTFLGGSDRDYAFALSPDNDGGVIVGGKTRSGDFPVTEGAYQENIGENYDAFITHLNGDGSELIYSTYIGGNNSDVANALCPDGVGGVVVAGYSWSDDFPTTEDAYQRDFGGGSSHPFIACLNGDGSDLIYSTFLGGNSGREEATALCPDGANGVIVTGTTYSNDFPTTEGAFDESFNGACDVFITDIDIGLPLPAMLFGHVYSLADDIPLSEALVFTSWGDSTVTDEEGYWYFDQIRSGVYNLTASEVGYNDSTLTDLEIVEAETLEVDLSLRHPELVLSVDEIVAEVDLGQSIEREFNVQNDGNGPMEWWIESCLTGESGIDPWEPRGSHPAGQILDDSRLQGVVFANDRFYITGGGNERNMVYILDREGNVVGGFEQFGDSHYGMRDLAYDGDLIWGTEERSVYGFTPDGELISEFQGPFNPNRNITWDSDRELLWISSITTNIVGFDREGRERDEISRCGLRIYGLAYWPDDPDGFGVYAFHSSDQNRQLVHKINPDTGDTLFVRQLEPEDGGQPGGAFATNQYDIHGSWVFMGIVNSGNEDRIDIWQLQANTDWMIIDPLEGVIDPENEQDIILTLDAGSLEPIVYEGEVIFNHLVAIEETAIPITLTVLEGGDEIHELTVSLAVGWNMISINVIPTEELWEVEEGPDITLMTEQLRIDEENHHIQLMKDDNGRFYAPSQNFNNIPYWDLTEGYQVNVDEFVAATWVGERIQAVADIPLERDWNLIAYFPAYELDANAPDFYCLSPIIDHVELVKDGLGRFMSPAFNFSNMPPWRETQGYYVKVDEDVVLNYPPEQDEEVIANDRSKIYQLPQCHWFTTPTDQNMSVLVTTINGINPSIGSQIAGFNSDGQVIGTGTLTDEGMCGLAIWGDDESTGKIDGLQPGEIFTLKLCDAKQKRELPLELIATLEGAGLIYEPDGLTVLEMVTETAIPEEFFLSEAYPNPFNATVRFSYGLSEASDVTIGVYDISGRLVTTLTNDKLMAGYHSVVWDGSATASGIYFVRMFASEFESVRKAMLLR